MKSKKVSFFRRFDFTRQCRQYNLKLWQCPGFLFPTIGLLIIITMISAYFIASRYVEPEIVALIVIGITAILMIMGYLIVGSFEHLAQANQMKSEFVNIVSHELRTPLTSVNWLLDLIISQQSGNGNTKLMVELGDIKESNQRMIRLINDLLNVSRIEQGRIHFKFKNISLKDMAEELIEEYAPLAKASSVTVKLHCENELPDVFADEGGLRLILKNLIDNAVKYSNKKGEVNITLKNGGARIRCEIEDEGVGIPAQDQKKIFQKFFRSRNVLKHKTTGTGLGLYISKQFTQLLRGRMGFWSKKDKGTTFWFEVPTA